MYHIVLKCTQLKEKDSNTEIFFQGKNVLNDKFLILGLTLLQRRRVHYTNKVAMGILIQWPVTFVNFDLRMHPATRFFLLFFFSIVYLHVQNNTVYSLTQTWGTPSFTLLPLYKFRQLSLVSFLPFLDDTIQTSPSDAVE